VVERLNAVVIDKIDRFVQTWSSAKLIIGNNREAQSPRGEWGRPPTSDWNANEPHCAEILSQSPCHSSSTEPVESHEAELGTR